MFSKGDNKTRFYNILSLVLIVAFVTYAGYGIGHNAGYAAGWHGAIQLIRGEAGEKVYITDDMQNAYEQGWSAAAMAIESDAASTVLYYSGNSIDLDAYACTPSGDVDTSYTDGILLDDIENRLPVTDRDY